MAKKPPTLKSVETIKHGADKRKNIPTAEHQSVLKQDDASPRPLKYPRNTDLDPQLVWRGKDEQDWSDLVVHAPPLYIQEKVHPIDTDFNEESFFVRHAYFLGANDPYSALKTTLKAEINQEAWSTLHSDTSRPFDKPKSGRIAVKVINHLGDEVMKVFRVD